MGEIFLYCDDKQIGSSQLSLQQINGQAIHIPITARRTKEGSKMYAQMKCRLSVILEWESRDPHRSNYVCSFSKLLAEGSNFNGGTGNFHTNIAEEKNETKDN